MKNKLLMAVLFISSMILVTLDMIRKGIFMVIGIMWFIIMLPFILIQFGAYKLHSKDEEKKINWLDVDDVLNNPKYKPKGRFE